jgi:hypothetical protein
VPLEKLSFARQVQVLKLSGRGDDDEITHGERHRRLVLPVLADELAIVLRGSGSALGVDCGSKGNSHTVETRDSHSDVSAAPAAHEGNGPHREVKTG